jgi:hypothetical protein
MPVMKFPPIDFNYLTVLGKLLTPNTNYFPSSTTQPAITATTKTDVLSTDQYHELALNFVVGVPTGTSPTLSISLLILDPVESANATPLTVALTATALTAAANIRAIITRDGILTVWINGTATTIGKVGVPMMWQVLLTLGGTTPSFPILATYEARQ